MLKVLEHPLITHKLTQMRRKECGTKDFRANLDEIAGLMAYEISRDLPLRTVDIETPVSPYTTKELAKDIVLVPIDVYKRQAVQIPEKLVEDEKANVIHVYYTRTKTIAKRCV